MGINKALYWRLLLKTFFNQLLVKVPKLKAVIKGAAELPQDSLVGRLWKLDGSLYKPSEELGHTVLQATWVSCQAGTHLKLRRRKHAVSSSCLAVSLKRVVGADKWPFPCLFSHAGTWDSRWVSLGGLKDRCCCSSRRKDSIKMLR